MWGSVTSSTPVRTVGRRRGRRILLLQRESKVKVLLGVYLLQRLQEVQELGHEEDADMQVVRAIHLCFRGCLQRVGFPIERVAHVHPPH